MSFVVVDVESDGPIPGDYSMVCFGAVIVEPTLSKTFYGQLKPSSEQWVPEALAVSGFSREDVLGFEEPAIVMQAFADWIAENSKGRPFLFRTITALTGSLSIGIFTISWAIIPLAIHLPILALCTKGWSRTPSRISSTYGKRRILTIRWMTLGVMQRRYC